MKKLLAICLCACLAFGAVGCKKNEEENLTEEPKQEETQPGTTQIPNPVVGFDTLKDAEEAVGFEFAIPSEIEGYGNPQLSVISGEIAQAIFKSEEDANMLTIRKSKGDSDNSGDYNSYETEKTVKVGEREVTLKGKGENFSLAIWNEEDFAFSLGTSGLSEDEMIKLIQDIK